MNSDTILIATSDDSVRQALNKTLAEHYILVHAKQGFEAVRLADSLKPALAMVDVDIPGLDGIDFCRRLKENRYTKDIPVILLASHTDKEDILFALQAGADDYLEKPVNPTEVLARIDAHLNYTKFLEGLEIQDLKLLLELANSISTLRNPKKILRRVVERVADILAVERCSIISIDNVREFTVKASSDLEGDEEIKLELGGYPEIRKAIETRSAVVVNDTLLDPLMEPVRKQIKKRGLNSIFVVPIIKKESVIGTLFLRTATKLQGGVSDRVYKLCQLVANISANALENAVLFESITTAKEVFDEVVTRDVLTRLYTHRYFYEQLEKEFSRAARYNSALSLILFNIDDFRTINAKYGHMLGDEVLKQVGRLVRAAVRDSDVAARYGGDEFALLLPSTDKNGALELARRISSLINKFKYDVLAEESITVSAGLATYSGGPSKTFDQLPDLARRAMATAKKKGKKQVIAHEKM